VAEAPAAHGRTGRASSLQPPPRKLNLAWRASQHRQRGQGCWSSTRQQVGGRRRGRAALPAARELSPARQQRRPQGPSLAAAAGRHVLLGPPCRRAQEVHGAVGCLATSRGGRKVPSSSRKCHRQRGQGWLAAGVDLPAPLACRGACARRRVLKRTDPPCGRRGRPQRAQWPEPEMARPSRALGRHGHGSSQRRS
jgi:hypothetical protein